VEYSINENCIYYIVRENEKLVTRYLPFPSNPLFNDTDYNKIIDILKSKKKQTWKDIRDLGFDSFNNIKRKYLNYFNDFYLCDIPNRPYSYLFTLGKSNTLKKLSNKPKDSNRKFYFNSTDRTYSLTTLKHILDETFLARIYNESIKSVKKVGALAYSHRERGWKHFLFKLDRNFKIDIFSNFGYGQSSYFTLIVYYKNIKIVPVSVIVEYRIDMTQSLLSVTDLYEVSYSSFKPCFDFTVNAVNTFNESKEGFIKKYIIEELDKLIDGLKKFIDRVEFNIYTTSRVRFQDRIGIEKENVIFDKYEINIFRSEKSLQTLPLLDTIDSLNEIINHKYYVNKILEYSSMVIKQNTNELTSVKKDVIDSYNAITPLFNDEIFRLESIYISICNIFNEQSEVILSEISVYTHNNFKSKLENSLVIFKYIGCYNKLLSYVVRLLDDEVVKFDFEYLQIFSSSEITSVFVGKLKDFFELGLENINNLAEAFENELDISELMKSTSDLLETSDLQLEDYKNIINNYKEVKRQITDVESIFLLNDIEKIITDLDDMVQVVQKELNVIYDLNNYADTIRNFLTTEMNDLSFIATLTSKIYDDVINLCENLKHCITILHPVKESLIGLNEVDEVLHINRNGVPSCMVDFVLLENFDISKSVFSKLKKNIFVMNQINSLTDRFRNSFNHIFNLFFELESNNEYILMPSGRLKLQLEKHKYITELYAKLMKLTINISSFIKTKDIIS